VADVTLSAGMSASNEEIDFTEKCEQIFTSEISGKSLDSDYSKSVNSNTYIFGWKVDTN